MKNNYALINEESKIVFHSESAGLFMTKIYPLLVGELIDQLKIDSNKYSNQLIMLKENKFDIEIVISVAELLGYHVKEMSIEEINNMRYRKAKQSESGYKIRRMDMSSIEKKKMKKEEFLEEVNMQREGLAMENREIEDLLIRLSRVSRDMTKSVNASGNMTKKQIKEQEIVVRKLSKKLDLDSEYLDDKLNE